jgi:hypothetical protein
MIVSLVLFLGSSASGQEKKETSPKTPAAPYPIPPDAVQQANPVKPTTESLAEGKKWFGYDCAMCHGKGGDGKGDVAADMKLKVSDYFARRRWNVSRHFLAVSNSENLLPSCSIR